MFVQNHFTVCLLAALAGQVFFVTATPVQSLSDELTEKSGETDGSEGPLETRGLFDYIPNPLSAVSTGIQTVDNGLRTARTQGSRAVRGTFGSGVELVTGINPNTLYELPQEMMKKAVRGARMGADVAYDVADKSLDTIQDLHDRKKQLLENYVKPVAPTMVGNVIDRANDRFDSTMESVKNGVQAGHANVVGRLAQLEERLENGDPILPTSLQTGINNVGKVLETGSGWLGSWMPSMGLPSIGPSPAGPEGITEVNKDAPEEKKVEEVAAAEAKPAPKTPSVKPPVTPGRRVVRPPQVPRARSFRFAGSK